MRITFRQDMTDFIRWNTHVEKELRQAIRAGVNTTAAQSRKNFIRAAHADIAGQGVTSGDVRKMVSPVNRASTTTLTASWTAKNTGFRRTPTIIAMKRGNQHKPGGGSVKTFAVSGGGSNPLTSQKLFMLESRGGRVVLVRQGKKLKRVYAEGPGSALGLERSAPRRALLVAAPEMLSRELNTRVQAVLNRGTGSHETGVGDP